MRKRGTLVWAAALMLLAGPFLSAQEDVQRYPSCKYCGMDRAMFAHSRMLVEYEDGSSVGVCSLHCAAPWAACVPGKARDYRLRRIRSHA